MSIFESIVNNFNEHLDLTSRNIENLTPLIAEAVHLFTEALLADNKIFCCTSGDNYGSGIQFCHNMQTSIGIQRPSLPVLFLGANTSSIVSMIDNHCPDEIYMKTLQALGNKDDILFIISSSGNEISLINAANIAHEKKMPVVMLLSTKHKELALNASPLDVVITVQSESTQQILATHFLITLVITQLIEQQLFGTIQS